MITLRNKIGQMLIMGFSGCEVHENSPIAQWLSQDGLAGVILFDKDLSTGTYGKNLKNEAQIKQLIHQLNHYASGMIPLLTAIDYEGGAVDRLSQMEDSMPTMSAYDLAQLPEEALVEEFKQMAQTLNSLGFNLNFAPVLDLHINESQGIIGKLKRSFSLDPQVVIRVATQFVKVFQSYGIACAYKHFPGHGSATGDSHEGFVDVTETFKVEELLPYNQLLQEEDKPVMVMTAHVINKKLDNKGLPATLSHAILTGLLRQSIGFDGIIISDDLQMHAIAQHFSMEEALTLTINAGADMMIFGNQLGNHQAPEIIDTIEQLVKNEKIEEERIDEAFRRVMRFKQQMKIIKLDEATDSVKI